MNFNFIETQQNEIIEKFGNEKFSDLLDRIDSYSQKWGLFDFEYATTSTYNVLLFCTSKQYGDCVLKLYGEMFEYNAYSEYSNSERFCKLYEFDIETRVMLIERIIPGSMLKEEPSLEKRLSVFSELLNGLHISPNNPDKTITYLKLFCDVTEAMKTHENGNRLYAYALKAKDILLEIVSIYDKELLLHWDLKNDNILLDKTGAYKLIDPFGFIGDPVLEVGRFISQEYWDADSESRMDTIEKIASYFEANEEIPKHISKKCFFIDIILLNCLWVERGRSACMDDVSFAETVLNI